MSDKEKKISIHQFDQDGAKPIDDLVTVEEPLEIRVVSGSVENRRGKSISITMRTPGHDHELAIGFLACEGIISTHDQVQSVQSIGTADNEFGHPNTVCVELTPDTDINYSELQRHFYSTSSCGVCGKASLEALEYRNLTAIQSELSIEATTILKLPQRLRENQTSFEQTGGIHAAGLFDKQGRIQRIREDVGRHNALDKLIGSNFLQKEFPMPEQIVVVSGRASFELLQKTLTAQIPIFVAVGAPSSLAVDLARQFDLTLIGFASNSRFNIYSSPQRVIWPK